MRWLVTSVLALGLLCMSREAAAWTPPALALKAGAPKAACTPPQRPLGLSMVGKDYYDDQALNLRLRKAAKEVPYGGYDPKTRIVQASLSDQSAPAPITASGTTYHCLQARSGLMCYCLFPKITRLLLLVTISLETSRALGGRGQP